MIEKFHICLIVGFVARLVGFAARLVGFTWSFRGTPPQYSHLPGRGTKQNRHPHIYIYIYTHKCAAA